MRIIIVGNGKVGYAIANSLAEEEHDLTVAYDDNSHNIPPAKLFFLAPHILTQRRRK